MVASSEIKESENTAWKTFSLIIRIIYFPFGLVLALIQILQAVGLCCSIIGIPIAGVLAKSVHVYFNPVGKICVSRSVAEAMKAQKGAEALARMQNKQ